MNPIKSSFFSEEIFRKIFLFLLLPAAVALQGSTVPQCSQCGEYIRPGQSYLRMNSKILCSRKCQLEVMPRCAQCQKPIEPGKRYLVSQKKPYCSRNCLSRIMPECTVCSRRSFNGGIYAGDHSYFACPDCMKLPRCFSCTIPVKGGKALPDGRHICPRCLKTAVTHQDTALHCFRHVRNVLRQQLRISTPHRITFSLVDQPTLHHLSTKNTHRRKQPGGSAAQETTLTEQGLFRFDGIIREYIRGGTFRKKTVRRTVTDARYSIYVLDHLSRERMEYVMAHELAHDYLSEHFPGIPVPWIQEGFAEYIGYLYNKHCKRDHLNIRLEKNPDPVYGEGFRKIRSIAEKQGWEGLKRFLRSRQKKISH